MEAQGHEISLNFAKLSGEKVWPKKKTTKRKSASLYEISVLLSLIHIA